MCLCTRPDWHKRSDSRSGDAAVPLYQVAERRTLGLASLALLINGTTISSPYSRDVQRKFRGIHSEIIYNNSHFMAVLALEPQAA